MKIRLRLEIEEPLLETIIVLNLKKIRHTWQAKFK